ncbi:hypothetical protein [Candidatus Finniella inopinata]|uniref:Uncharacterized protein n=1 Tax=Candidatus Finniella inopinata TaxID=1696036 RepID=A0A4Q7DH85_9PROT|nr:hypothetical protein [Candidatus Finniella inopinata]RZI45489.1 hypothetical protein EQU50_07015 [Candidatus Finniella inopinata]
MPTLPHDIDQGIPFNFSQPCPCGNSSTLNALACFLHADGRQEQTSRNIWLVLLIGLCLYLSWTLIC